jgi:peptide/nickel transport system permease protein
VEAIRLLKRRPWGIAGAVILLAVVLLAILSPILAPYHPNNIDLDRRLEPPGGDYIMGTDNLGRDVFSRFLYGSRPYLETGLIAIGASIVLGLLLGFISTIISIKTASILKKAIVTPAFLVALVVLAIIMLLVARVSGFGLLMSTLPFINPELTTVIIGLLLSFVFLPSVYTIAQTAFKACKDKGKTIYRALGKGFITLLSLTLVNLGIGLGVAVLIIAPMTFYGFGIHPPLPEWGGMLSGTGRTYMLQAPWIFLFPFIAIGVTVLGFILYGLALREIWFPRLPAVPVISEQHRNI